MFAVGEKILGVYTVEKYIGAGGAGEVFLVRRQRDNRQYAVKCVHSRKMDATKLRQDLLREIKISQKIGDHPNIVPVNFFRIVHGNLLLFSDFIAGGTLAKWIRNGRLKTIEDLLDVAIRTAWGLDISHQAGILHKDIKPSNILMEKSGRPRLADFGLIRGMTPGYCSPEQMADEPLTYATDIWSWALVVMTMWIGERSWQFGGQGNEHLRLLQLDTNRFGVAPESLIGLLGQCLELDPSNRPVSAAIIAEDLKVIYRELTRQNYPLSNPPEIDLTPSKVPTDRISVVDGTLVEDPQSYLQTLSRALSKSDPKVIQLIPELENQPASFLDDLHLYMFIEEMLRKAAAQGEAWILKELAYVLKRKGWLLFDTGDLDGAISEHEKANEILHELILWHGRDDLWVGVAGNYSDIVFCLSHAKKYDKIADYNEQAKQALDMLPLQYRDPTYHQDYHHVLTMSGILATQEERYQEALDFLIQSRDRLELIPEDAITDKIIGTIAKAEFNIGTCLEKSSHFDQAILHYEKALETQKKVTMSDNVSDQLFLASICQNIGICYGQLDRNHEADTYFIQAEKIFTAVTKRSSHPHVHGRLAAFLRNYGHFHLLQGNYSKTISLLEKAIAIFKEALDKHGMLSARQNLARVYGEISDCYALSGNDDAAEKALELAKQYDEDE